MIHMVHEENQSVTLITPLVHEENQSVTLITPSVVYLQPPETAQLLVDSQSLRTSNIC